MKPGDKKTGRVVARYCVEHLQRVVSATCCTWAECSHVPRCEIRNLVIGPPDAARRR